MPRLVVRLLLLVLAASFLPARARAGDDAAFVEAFRRGGALFKARDLAGAERALSKAVEVSPDRAEGWNALALVVYDRRQSRRAVSYLDRAIALQPGYREAWLNRGLARFSLGQYAESLTDLNKVLSFPVPDDLVTDFDLAVHMYRAKVKAGEISVPFEAALARGLLPVDREAAYAHRFIRLARVLAAGPGFVPAHFDRSVHYEVATDDSVPFARVMAFHLELALTEYRRIFPPANPPPEGLRFRAKIFSERRRYVTYLTDIIRDRATAEISGGSYHPVTRELLLTKHNRLEGTLLVLFHEGFHQYLDSFLASPPIWFSEGAADFFGAATVKTNRMVPGGIHPLRIEALRKALAAKEPPDFVALLKATPTEFMNTRQANLNLREAVVSRNYALAWALVHYLLTADDKGILKSYYACLLEGGNAGQAYQRAFGGVDPADLRDRVLRHAREVLLP
jgi:tetratricopeptide (TPR) repeat protein